MESEEIDLHLLSLVHHVLFRLFGHLPYRVHYLLQLPCCDSELPHFQFNLCQVNFAAQKSLFDLTHMTLVLLHCFGTDLVPLIFPIG